MKSKCFFVSIVAAVLVGVVVVTSIVPVYAAGAVAGAVIEDVLWDLIRKCITPDGMDSPEASYEENIKYLNKVWLTGVSARKEVDYSTLSYVYAQLLVNGVPCEIRTSRGSDQGYYIRGTGFMPVYNGNGNYGIKDKYFSDGNGSVFYAELPDNGKTPDSTTVPSTTPPVVEENTNTTYIPSTSGDLSYLTPSNELQALQYINSHVTHIANQLHRVQDRLRDIQQYTFRLYINTIRFIDGFNNVTAGIYEQVDLLTGYLPRLDDIYARLFDIQTASWASVDAQNRVFSAVAGLGSRLDTLIINSNTLVSNTSAIGSRLDGIINNGAVQVNTASVDARLDKLISMYSKVNSVVLDTAAVNGGQVIGAVGGALQDVMIYGRTRRENSQLTTTLPGLSVNGTPFVLGNTPLRSVHFTASVPAYITNDADLAAGVWKAGTYNYVSDTYNASTGEYVQRINAITLTGEETWSMAARAGSSSIFYTSFTGSNLRAECNLFNYVVPSTDFTQASANVDALGAAFTIYSNALRFVSPVTSVDAWKTYLKNRVAAGNPVTVFWVPDPATEGTGTVSSWYADTAPSISIPEGDSTIIADNLRVTAKYETYESYTKTADIIAAIDRLQLGVAPDLDPIVSRLDTLISQPSDTVVNVVTNNTYITSVYQLDDENDVADRSKEGIEKIGGVFKWLWKHAFKDAFGAADITKLDGLL